MIKRIVYTTILIVTAIVPDRLQADTANVTIYGTGNLAFETNKATGGNNPANDYVSRFRIANNSSWFGLKGTHDMGDGFKAFFQWETSANQVTAGGFTGTRNSGVGLSSETCGTVVLGFWDTPYKIYATEAEVFFSSGTSNQAAIHSTAGSNGASGNAVVPGSTNAQRLSFSRRSGSSIQWWSPTFMGLTARIMYGTNVNKAVSNPNLFSASLQYQLEALKVSYAHERHADFLGTPVGFTVTTKNPVTASIDTGHRVVANYELDKDSRVSAVLDIIKYKGTQAAGDTEYSRTAYVVETIQGIYDKLSFRGSLGIATNGKGTTPTGDMNVDGFGATMGVLGFDYGFTKRTHVFTYYSKIWNKYRAQYNYFVNPIGYSSLMDPGQDPQTVALGLRHQF